MRWEWAIGEVILLAVAVYELWSLRRYDRPKTEADHEEADQKEGG